MNVRIYHLPAVLLVLGLVPQLAEAQSLVGYWEAEGDATATVGTDGTLTNGASITTGQFGDGFSFNGASQQYVEVAGGGGLNGLSEGTISMWVQWNGTQDAACCGGTAGNVLSRQQNGVYSNNIIGLSNTDPNSGALTWQPYSTTTAITGSTPVGDGVWRHVSVTFSDGYHALYLDGVLQGVSAASDTFDSNVATALAIGAWNGDGAGYSTAIVDDVAIYNRELSINQVQSLASGASPLSIQDPILGVTATASSELGGSFSRPAGNTVDGVGRGAIDPDGIPGTGDGMWLSEGIGFNGGNDTDPQITFDLGAPTEIGEMVVYNYNEFTNGLSSRGVDEFEILVSMDGIVFESLGIESLDEATGDGTNPGQVFDLDVLAQYVRFDILSNHAGVVFPNPTAPADFGFVGLSEVEFFAPIATAVPEPTTMATWMLMGLIGGAFGWTRIRRKA